MARVARVPELRGRRLTLIVAGLLAVVVVVQSLLAWERPGVIDRVAFTAVPVVLLAVVLGSAVDARRWYTAGSLLVAVAPAALAAAAGAGWEGAFAVLAACAALGVDRLPARLAWPAALGFVLVGIGLWVAASPGHGELPAPSWRAILGSTGNVVRASTATVGDGTPIPSTAMLGWWLAVGLVLGVAVTTGAWRRALVVPAAMALLIVVSWATARWYGPVAAGGGTWLVSGAVAHVGATRVPVPGADRRVGRCLVVAASWIWLAAVARQLRSLQADTADGDVIWGGSLATTSAHPALLLAAATTALVALAVVLCLSGGRSATAP